MKAEIIRKPLTDSSYVYDVVLTVASQRIVLQCDCWKAADVLQRVLTENVVGVECE